MKRGLIWLLCAILACTVVSCGQRPEALNEQEQRVYDALVMMAEVDSSIRIIQVNGLDTGFLPEHLNIDIDITYTQNGEEQTALKRLMLESGSLVQDPYGYYSDTNQSNAYMKVLNINHALEQYFNDR